MPNIFERAAKELKHCHDPHHIYLAKQLELAKRRFLHTPTPATRRAVDYAAGCLKEVLKCCESCPEKGKKPCER